MNSIKQSATNELEGIVMDSTFEAVNVDSRHEAWLVLGQIAVEVDSMEVDVRWATIDFAAV